MVPRLVKAASASTGQTVAMGLMPSDFRATISLAPVIRPKTLLTEYSIATGMVMPSISGKMKGMLWSIISGGNPSSRIPRLNPMPKVKISVRATNAAKKYFSTSQTTYRVKIYMA